MHILLIGCGRSGRHLAEILTDAGIDLIVIDENENNLQALADLDVICIQGVPIDTDILEQAGIENAAAVIAMDNRENINIMCCQIARTLYKIEHVIARTYTPSNEEFYHRLGIATICSTELTVAHALRVLGFSERK